jgi:sugar lactone lactonase YvrE
VSIRSCIAALAVVLLAAAPSAATSYRIDTYAGGGSTTDGSVGDGLPAVRGVLDRPSGLARGARGLFIADHDGGRVRRVRTTRGGRVITTVAGAGEAGVAGDDIRATDALLVQPTGVALLANGDVLVCEAGNDAGENAVRRVDARGFIHTFAGIPEIPPGNAGDGGPANHATLHTPLRMAVARNGDVYIVELNNHQVRLVHGGTRVIETVVGTGIAGNGGDEGPAMEAQLRNPAGIALGPKGTLYVADFGNHRLRVVTPDGIIHALAGTGVETNSVDGPGGDPSDDRNDGPASRATFSRPTGIAVDKHGALLVADQGNHLVRRIERDATGVLGPDSPVTTIAGTGVEGFSGDGGDALVATLRLPTDVLPLPRGRILVADRGNQRVRLLVPVTTDMCDVGCSDGDPATVDVCDPTVGCSHALRTPR